MSGSRPTWRACLGCGGGSGSPPAPGPSFTPTPVATTLSGATFALVRTATAPGYTTGLTCGNPQRAGTQTSTAAITASVVTGQTFQGLSGLIAVTSTTASKTDSSATLGFYLR
jgi:hypothetical protein